MTMTTTVVETILAFLATYLVHSTVLLGAAWALGRYVVRAEAWRETLWRAALVGGVATALLAQTVPLAPGRFSWSVAMDGPAAASTPEVADAESERAGHEGSEAVRDGSAVRSDAGEDDGMTMTGTPSAPAADLRGPSFDPRGATERAGSSADAVASVGGTGSIGSPGPATDRNASSEERLLALSSLPGAIALGWALVALALLLRFAVGRQRLARILRDRRAVTDPALAATLAGLRRSAGLWTPVSLTATPVVSSPLLLGRREICVPERFMTDLGPDEQRAALAHELGHLARRDPAWQLVALVLECVFFFQPLHRVARRGLRESAEYLADAWAVRLSGERLGLARCLSEVAAWVAPQGEASVAHTVAMAEGGSPLLARVSRLLERDPEVEPKAAARFTVGVVLIVATAVAVPGVGAEPDRGAEEALPEETRLEGTGGASTSGDVTVDAGVDASLETPSEADLPPPEPTSADQIAPSIIRVPVEGGLEDRMGTAAARAEGSARYWAAWAVPSLLPATTHVSMDSEQGFTIHVTEERSPMLSSMSAAAPAAAVLGVQGEMVGGDGTSDVLFLARIDAGSESPRVTRLMVRSPRMPLRISGDVYWLGRATSEEGFAWQVREYRGASDRRIAEVTVKAVALHDAAGVEGFLREIAGETAVGGDVRESAIEGLAYHPSDASFDFLTRMAEADPALDMRLEAVETLGELDHPEAAGAVQNLARGGDPRVREEAIESLGEGLQDAGVIATLLEVARTDPDPDVRAAAVEAIGQQPPDRAVPALRALIEEGADDDVLMEVAEQLGEAGTPAALEALDALVAADPASDVVEEAVEAIAEGFAAALAGPRLEAISRDHPSRDVRREALELLLDLRIGGADVGDLLLDIALNHADPESRIDAVERMTDLPVEAAVGLLGRVAAESGDVEVRAEVADVLGDVGTPAALAVLDDLVTGEEDEDVVLEALESIGEGFPPDQAIPVLQRIVTEHPSARVRREAVEQLADIGAEAGPNATA